MSRYLITMSVVACSFVILVFCIFLGCFPMVITWYHAHSGGDLMIYGSVKTSRQLMSLYQRSQGIVMDNYWYVSCSYKFG